MPSWDDAKARNDLAKHGVAFPYAIRVFLDPEMVDLDASREGDKETRRKAVGMVEGKMYAVVYADREGRRRIISARRTNAMEQGAYGPV